MSGGEVWSTGHADVECYCGADGGEGLLLLRNRTEEDET